MLAKAKHAEDVLFCKQNKTASKSEKCEYYEVLREHHRRFASRSNQPRRFLCSSRYCSETILSPIFVGRRRRRSGLPNAEDAHSALRIRCAVDRAQCHLRTGHRLTYSVVLGDRAVLFGIPNNTSSAVCYYKPPTRSPAVITNYLRKNRQGIASDLRPPPPSAMQSHHRLLIRFTRGVRTLRLPLGIVQQETFFTLRSPSSHLRDKTT